MDGEIWKSIMGIGYEEKKKMKQASTHTKKKKVQ